MALSFIDCSAAESWDATDRSVLFIFYLPKSFIILVLFLCFFASED